MSDNDELYRCQVCGFSMKPLFPWGDDGKSSSFDICPCCLAEFGLDDEELESTRAYRKIWLFEGAIWRSSEQKPLEFDLEKQLARIPKGYL